MKKLILLSLLLLLTSFNLIESDVFICGTKGAKKYHYSKNCRGLSNCKHEIKKVSLKEAKRYGLELCGWED